MSLQNPIPPSCRYLVIGNPIAHSLSPAMQNAAFAYYNLGTPYGKYCLEPEDLQEFFDFARTGLDGFNVTVPYKEAVIPFLDTLSPEAKACNSVNTVIIRNHQLHGDSTDGYGLATALKDNFKLDISGKTFLFVGTGGAANAAAWHFAPQSPRKIILANRTFTKADQLARKLHAQYPNLDICPLDLADQTMLTQAIQDSDCILQATSVGLKNPEEAPFDPRLLENTHAAFFDFLYHPTALLKQAARLGLPHACGIDMLLHQGAKAFTLWTGLAAPLPTMRQTLKEFTP